MKPRRLRNRRTLWIGIIALATALGVLWQNLDELQFRWYLYQRSETVAAAREQILSWESSFKTAETLTGPLQQLESDGERGFRAIATFLEDDDPRVWVRTAELIDFSFILARGSSYGYDPKSVKRVVSDIRSFDQTSVLKFLLFESYQHNTEWRNYVAYYAPDGVGFDWRFGGPSAVTRHPRHPAQDRGVRRHSRGKPVLQ
ncbi:MAG: hypothetical protein AAF517_06880 [Planctomycetota bacterium]